MNRTFSFVSCVWMLVFLSGSTLSAGTILKTDFGNTGPDFAFDGSTIATPNDGDQATVGLQSSSVNFSGFLDGVFADLPTAGSLSISGIGLDEPVTGMGAMLVQKTLGGSFSIFDASNALLLSGLIDKGLLLGMTGTSSASFQSLGPLTFNGGSLLSLIEPTVGSLNLNLGDVQSGGQSGLTSNNGILQPFTASAVGQVAAAPAIPAQLALPEPGTISMFAGVLALTAWRFRRRAM